MTMLGSAAEGPALVTGGAGFVGCNLAARLLASGRTVTVLDDLSRPGVAANLAWLESSHPRGLRVVRGDVRDARVVREALEGVAQVFHFAAQVAVTTSLSDPLRDLDVNARGTLTVLEEARRAPRPPGVLFTSTNKVYGALADIALARDGQRYVPALGEIAARGIAEERPLDFHSPYGCSKGAADQYVLDYARTFGLRTVVFRMSCIYGPRQLGTEDQGWVAHFVLRALRGEPITIYGDGFQVRDLLYVGDLVDAFLAAEERIDVLAGRAFNVGGGPRNAASLLEVVDRIEELTGRRPALEYADWRPGDQRYYCSDVSAFAVAADWTPRTGVAEGLRRLHDALAGGTVADERRPAQGGLR